MSVKSVAIVGAGAAGAVTAAAFHAEKHFDVIRVFERRDSPGGTWIYDPDPGETWSLQPGLLPTELDPPLQPPKHMPQTIAPNLQKRWEITPIYAELTTNVPNIAMSFSDQRFAYGPFVPHWIPKQYIQDYFAKHRADSSLVLCTTVEEVTKLPPRGPHQTERWKLTLRRYDAVQHLDAWWEEEFDAVVFANGHYSVPFIPRVQGLEDYIEKFPDRVTHSKTYRIASLYRDKRVLVIGNSASGHDITTQLVQSGVTKLPVYQSRRTHSRWDGKEPPENIEWKPVVREYRASTNEIIFDNDTVLTDVDVVIYCTGYKASFPFWNNEKNGGPLFDYRENRLLGFYQHTFSQLYPQSLGVVGLPRVLTFRSFEYQAVALARVFAGRSSHTLPSLFSMKKWERERAELVRKERRKFHDIQWDNGETDVWIKYLYDLAGLPTLDGHGRCPPALDEKTRWAIEHVRKYPEPGKDEEVEGDWVKVENAMGGRDSLHFI
ncbi:dimethylaniline monooxygenase (N-oxide forming) [Dendryphion nanum]|uniref:Dimethylaniline monooxygenase (N-oxide forming) n=1 Tax=Dendryphion nanum TaxID=256645 RepID=A0A9P9IQ61_9PLEO|nr:dimethylaniline monooxygenase (N-oxide forming) [Dendryphion nanum]